MSNLEKIRRATAIEKSLSVDQISLLGGKGDILNRAIAQLINAETNTGTTTADKIFPALLKLVEGKSERVAQKVNHSRETREQRISELATELLQQELATDFDLPGLTKYLETTAVAYERFYQTNSGSNRLPEKAKFVAKLGGDDDEGKIGQEAWTKLVTIVHETRILPAKATAYR